MIFDEDDILFFGRVWEWSDMSSQKCRKWTNWPHGLNFKIVVNSEVIFEINDENYPMKKISCLSDHFEIFVTQPGRSLRIVFIWNYLKKRLRWGLSLIDLKRFGILFTCRSSSTSRFVVVFRQFRLCVETDWQSLIIFIWRHSGTGGETKIPDNKSVIILSH